MISRRSHGNLLSYTYLRWCEWYNTKNEWFNNTTRGFIHAQGPKKRKHDYKTCMGLFFANNIHLKQI